MLQRFVKEIYIRHLNRRALLSYAPAGSRPFVPRRQAGYIRGVVGPIELEPFENVIANDKATVTWRKLIGRSVDRIILQLGGGNTKANMTLIRVLANEKPIFDDSGSRTDSRMQYRGLAAAATFLPLSFIEERARTVGQLHAGAIDTRASNIATLTCEATLGAGVAPTLKGFAYVSPSPQSGDPRYNAVIGKVLNKTFNFGAAGEFPVPLAFSRNPNSFVKRIHFFGATVTDIRYRKTYPDNITDEPFKSADALNDFAQGEYQRTPQANIFTVDFCYDGDIGRALPLGDALSIEWFSTVSGAGNVTPVSELLDPLENN